MNQKVLAPSYGLRCAQVPSLRLCSVGTPPRAIHGPSRLSRHPCRSTHSTEPPLGLPGGLVDQKHCGTRRPTGRPVRFVCSSSTATTETLAPTIGLYLQQSIYRCKRDPSVNSEAAAAAGLKTSHLDFFTRICPGPITRPSAATGCIKASGCSVAVSTNCEGCDSASNTSHGPARVVACIKGMVCHGRSHICPAAMKAGG